MVFDWAEVAKQPGKTKRLSFANIAENDGHDLFVQLSSPPAPDPTYVLRLLLTIRQALSFFDTDMDRQT